VRATVIRCCQGEARDGCEAHLVWLPKPTSAVIPLKLFDIKVTKLQKARRVHPFAILHLAMVL
jgi:hypothetical protein